ncbi:MAG: hypothetical protein KME23_00835, partial [Goleter apudmare HA4340-LM2]|nr:hypothetical protein [Goleter apudmare HA4340-LM2]
MTPRVANTTSIPTKDWRRHTDSPSLWIAVVIGSVSLHLLAFWLIRSYQSHLLWRQESQATIPIDFIEISPRPKAETRAQAKAVTPRSTTQQLPKQVVPTQQPVAKPVPTPQDQSAIALAKQRQRELDQQRQRELDQQRQRELDQQRQRELDQQRQRELDQQR